MIGNDIIDLHQSRRESNWQRKGFQEKIFTAQEQWLIANNTDPEMLVWLLWSMKEAAYKILNRQTKIREFIPKKLTCKLLSYDGNNATGQVVYFENIYHTKTLLCKDLIHTIAVNYLEDLDQILEIEKKDILKDTDGVPWINTHGHHYNKAVSISNHGRFEKIVTIRTRHKNN